MISTRFDSTRDSPPNQPRISTAESRVSVWVIPTDEELMIAQHTLALIRPSLS
jgi:acetate kinase